jgi:phosphoribosylformylglycinamidine synthase
MYKATVNVTLRPSILDPQGKATQRALHDLGAASVSSVRIGKYIELTIDARTEAEAREVATKACQQLLANPVMEDFSVSVQPQPA